jgi:hypothetical protein
VLIQSSVDFVTRSSTPRDRFAAAGGWARRSHRQWAARQARMDGPRDL